MVEWELSSMDSLRSRPLESVMPLLLVCHHIGAVGTGTQGITEARSKAPGPPGGCGYRALSHRGQGQRRDNCSKV